MAEAATLPPKLAETLDLLALMPDRADRIQLLIDLSDRFVDVPPRVAVRPFSCDDRVPACESEAYVWAERRPDGRLDFHFAVENPQGISAKSFAAVLRESLSGQPLEQIAALPTDLVYDVYGQELSMGKSMGLMAMLQMVKALSKKALGEGVVKEEVVVAS